IPGLIAAGITVAIAWVQSPFPGAHFHITLYGVPAATYLLAEVAYFAGVAIAVATYYAMAFLCGFMPASGVAYLVRKAYQSLKGRSHEKGSVPMAASLSL